MVREEEVGKTYTVTLNGIKFTTTISQNPEDYEFYSLLGLDVFVRTEKEELMGLLDELGIPYKKNSSVKTLKKKLDDSLSESDNNE